MKYITELTGLFFLTAIFLYKACVQALYRRALATDTVQPWV